MSLLMIVKKLILLIYAINEGNVIFTISGECVECGACAAVCPVGAILAP